MLPPFRVTTALSNQIEDVAKFAREIRISALRMVTVGKSSHIGSAFSMADIVAVLYDQVMTFDPENQKFADRDRLILSKGHACSIIYAALAAKGFFPGEELKEYASQGSRLLAHISHRVPGVEFSTGSLGHGIPFGVGKAYAARQANAGWHTFVIAGDGEMAEGSNWEALLFAAHHQLSNLTVIVDRNNLQSLTTVDKTLGLEPLGVKLEAFGCEVYEVDGHNYRELISALTPEDKGEKSKNQPRVVIANTTKGKGVSFMENSVAWHYKNPSAEQFELALAELEES